MGGCCHAQRVLTTAPMAFCPFSTGLECVANLLPLNALQQRLELFPS